MVAYVLREVGDDPAWIIGGVVPQLGGNAGTGRWLVVEGDESDRSIGLFAPEIAVVTNASDHHATFA
jgi:UDP-N-acetylmuramate--alanine ligase